MDVTYLGEDLATGLFTQDQVDAHIHHQLFLQDLFYLLHCSNLIEVNWHFKLLVVTALDQSFRADKCEDYCSDIGGVWSILVLAELRGANKFSYIDTHGIQFVDEDLIDLELSLKLLKSLTLATLGEPVCRCLATGLELLTASVVLDRGARWQIPDFLLHYLDLGLLSLLDTCELFQLNLRLL